MRVNKIRLVSSALALLLVAGCAGTDANSGTLDRPKSEAPSFFDSESYSEEDLASFETSWKKMSVEFDAFEETYLATSIRPGDFHSEAISQAQLGDGSAQVTLGMTYGEDLSPELFLSFLYLGEDFLNIDSISLLVNGSRLDFVTGMAWGQDKSRTTFSDVVSEQYVFSIGEEQARTLFEAVGDEQMQVRYSGDGKFDWTFTGVDRAMISDHVNAFRFLLFVEYEKVLAQ
jgi:hypothetical protein